jgi:hypothetical protein
MKKYFLFSSIIISTFLLLPVYVLAVTNSGFIPGQIWYSKDTLVEGDTVDIHTAVFNGEKNSILAKVEFYDKNVILGSRDITLTSLELKDVFVSWKVTSGDHVISAKITSSQQTVLGKKEKIILGRNETSDDKQFVSVVVRNDKGEPISETNTIQNKLENTGEKINDLLPKEVSDSISSSFTVVENFRTNTSVQINKTKEETKKEIASMESEDKSILDKVAKEPNLEDSTKKPITYIKLFLFTILALIFSNKILFYVVLVLVVFFILRKIYRLIRNR